ncbi:YebC/PmpR family DNA-binding transcriptional regulator [Arsenophonus symbiont of Ornithomya chloropus]|uniref:YebC/PmpR family DNA-binding transcriptional regulator n=1 Tax=Arsenophonus symbiont of Ornithomya chloropus TaxID=634121 RepID=UPI0032B21231
MIDCLTDNRNRTISNIRIFFTKYFSILLIKRDISYLFIKRGILSYAFFIDKNSFMEVILNISVEDIKYYDGIIY